MIETVPAVVCDVCKANLAIPRLLIKEYLQVIVGIHPEAFPEWEPPMPAVQASLAICLEHGEFPILVAGISEIMGFNVEGTNQPELEPGLGHFITAIEIIHGHGRFFNLQTNREKFIQILSKFPIFASILCRGWEMSLNQPC